MRILLVHNSADIYGASRSLVRFCGRLLARGHEPQALLPEDGALAEMLRKRGVPVHIQKDLTILTRLRFQSWRKIPFAAGIPISAWRIRRLLRRERIQLVHSNVGTVVSPALAARLAGVPHVWHIRDWYQEFRGFWRYYRACILAFSDRIVAVSTPIAEQFPPSDKRVVVIHNGFDMAEFDVDRAALRAAFRERFDLGSALVIGCVGRIKFQRKGQEFLVQACERLKKTGRDFRLVFVGTAHPDNREHEVRLRELVKSCGLEPVTTFAGEMADPLPAYAAFDICVIPSAQPEPFAGVTMEAMAMGLPVVATRLGGFPEQVVEGETGLLVEPADPAELAAALDRLVADAGLRERMGRSGTARIRGEFSIDRMADQLIAIYEECLASREKSAS